MLAARHWQNLGMLALFASMGFGVGPAVRAAHAQAGANDAQVEADAHKALSNKKYANVSISVQGGNAVLRGTVDQYADKVQAEDRIHRVTGVQAVDDEIRVAGPTVEDTVLRDKLAKALASNRVGYGTTAFNAVTLAVKDGIVTLGGTVYGPPDKDAALGLVATTPGVKGIIDNLKVAPLSPMDDQLRLTLERAIYGTPQLQQYALNPDKPIRITVVSGNVTLSGVVDSKADRDIAGIKANSVPGVFKVTNDLEVAGPQPGK